MLAGDSISSGVTLPLPCVLDLCDASHADQSADLIASDVLVAVGKPL